MSNIFPASFLGKSVNTWCSRRVGESVFVETNTNVRMCMRLYAVFLLFFVCAHCVCVSVCGCGLVGAAAVAWRGKLSEQPLWHQKQQRRRDST